MGDEQREVIVAGMDNQQCPYSFRASHLKRVSNDGSTRFEVGDRVQLDIARYRPKNDMFAGKCLGTADDGAYGLVCSVGVVRDGCQRNVEVVAVGGPRNGMVSMYSACALTEAVRSTVLTDQDRRLLIDIVEELIFESGISYDAEYLVSRFGLGVWTRLRSILEANLSSAATRTFNAWKSFESDRLRQWLPEPPLESLNACYSVTSKAKLVDQVNSDCPLVSFMCRRRVDSPSFWTCRSCKLDKNPSSKTACISCSVKAPRWMCEGCSASNNIDDQVCIACFMYFEDSVNLRAAKLEARQKRDKLDYDYSLNQLVYFYFVVMNFICMLCVSVPRGVYTHELQQMLERYKRESIADSFVCKLSPTMVRLADSISKQQLLRSEEETVSADSDNVDKENTNLELLPDAEEETEDDAIYDDDDDDDKNFMPDDFELKMNESAAELYFMKYLPVTPPVDAINSFTRQNSAGFYSMHQYHAIEKIEELVSFRDKNGNGAAHHAASIGLRRTVEALFAAGAKRWIENSFMDSPSGLLDGLPMFSDEGRNTLYRAVAKHGLLDPDLVQYTLRIPQTYVEPAVFSKLVECIHGGTDNDDYDGAYYAEQHVKDNIPQAKLYRALFYILKGYGTVSACEDIKSYLQEVQAGSPDEFSPLYFYARFLLWKMAVGKPSHAKRDKLLASGIALISSLTCYKRIYLYQNLY
jgi:hypothetical protein